MYIPVPKIWRAWFYDFLLSETNTTANLVERSVTAGDTTQMHNATREHFKPRATTKILPILDVIYVVLVGYSTVFFPSFSTAVLSHFLSPHLNYRTSTCNNTTCLLDVTRIFETKENTPCTFFIPGVSK